METRVVIVNPEEIDLEALTRDYVTYVVGAGTVVDEATATEYLEICLEIQ